MGARSVTLATAVAVAGVAVLSFGAPAWANSTPTLNQTNVFADKTKFGKCTEKPDQSPTEDIWVFVWPGNSAGDLVDLTLNFDTDGDGDVDAVRTEDDATKTVDQGTAKWWVSTPAGWKLVNGTSEITGTVPQNQFQLTHSCGGGGTTTPTPGPSPSPSESDDTPPSNGESTPPGDGDGGLPVTGAAVGGAVVLGLCLVAAGVALVAIRRRRDVFDSGA